MMDCQAEALYGRGACKFERTVDESCHRIFEHLKNVLLEALDKKRK